MRFCQPDHAFELAGGGGDAALGGADVLAELAHGDVGGDEGFAGGGGDGGLDVGAGVGDVGGEEFDGLTCLLVTVKSWREGFISCAYQDLVFACVVRRVFEVHADQVAGELAVGGFLYAVEH